MKNLSLGIILTLCTQVNTFAATSDSHSLPIIGTESTDSFSLFTTATRTEYRYETEARTCFRTEIIGYQTICDRVGDVQYDPRGPRPEPRPEPRPPMPPMPPRPICHQEPVYRTIPYTCYETVRVPYEVVDHQTVSNFNVNMTNAGAVNNNAQCFVNFTMTGDYLTTGTSCQEYLVLATNSQNTSIDQRGTRVQNYNFQIKLLDRHALLAPLDGGLTNLHMEGENLVFTTGDLNLAKNATLRLFVERRRFLKSDETIIDRALSPNEYSYVSLGGTTGVTTIDLNKLIGGINKSKKHKIKVQLDVQLPSGNVLNNNMPNLHQESEITVWEN